PLLEVITDKVNAEVPSPFAGVLKEILVEEGATGPNDAAMAVIETADEATAGETAEAKPTAKAVTPDERPAASTEPSTPEKPGGSASSEPAATTGSAAAERPQFVPADGPAGSDERPERAAASATPSPTAVAAEPSEAPGHHDARMT